MHVANFGETFSDAYIVQTVQKHDWMRQCLNSLQSPMEFSLMSKSWEVWEIWENSMDTFCRISGKFLNIYFTIILPLVELPNGESCGTSTSTNNALSIKNHP